MLPPAALNKHSLLSCCAQFWFTKIVGGIMRVLQGKPDGSADGYTRDEDEGKKK